MVAVEALGWALLLSIGFACLALWNRALRHLASGREIIPYEPRRPVNWTFIDLAWVFLAFFVLQQGCVWILVSDDEQPAEVAVTDVPEEQVVSEGVTEAGADNGPDEGDVEQAHTPAEMQHKFAEIAAVSLGNALTLLVAILWLRLRGADRRDLGFDLSQAGRDVRLGAAGFAMASAPVLLIQGLLSLLIKPTHPVSDILKAQPSTAMIVLTAFFAVVIAPLFEEFFFRVMLQGWLEAVYPPFSAGVRQWFRSAVGNRVDIDNPPAGDDDRPAPLRTATFEERPSGSSQSTPGHVPTLITSLLFALVHLQYGPSAVPLFFFALVLGYLYRQTHRMWPSVVAHACLNGLSTLVMLAGGG